MKNPLFLFVLALLLCIGCCHVSHRAPKQDAGLALVEFGAQVEAELSMVTRAEVFGVDENYLSLTDAHITAMLADVDKHRHRGRYLRDLWDCDDIANEFRVLASDWAVRVFRDPPAGLAVALLYVKTDGKVDGLGDFDQGMHVMVAVRRTDGVWFLVEPSQCKRAELTGPLYEGVIEVVKVTL